VRGLYRHANSQTRFGFAFTQQSSFCYGTCYAVAMVKSSSYAAVTVCLTWYMVYVHIAPSSLALGLQLHSESTQSHLCLILFSKYTLSLEHLIPQLIKQSACICTLTQQTAYLVSYWHKIISHYDTPAGCGSMVFGVQNRGSYTVHLLLLVTDTLCVHHHMTWCKITHKIAKTSGCGMLLCQYGTCTL